MTKKRAKSKKAAKMSKAGKSSGSKQKKPNVCEFC